MPTFDIDTIAAALDGDGDLIEIPSENGTWTFRLEIHADQLSYEDVEDRETFGKVQWIDSHSLRERSPRPGGFTGAAFKMDCEAYPGTFWYEPPKEFRKFKGSGFETWDDWFKARDAHKRHVRSVVSWGYISVTITAEHYLPDGYHRSWDASLSGVESEADRAYLDSVFHDVLSDLIGEIS
jgi:hypothetical protein